MKTRITGLALSLGFLLPPPADAVTLSRADSRLAGNEVADDSASGVASVDIDLNNFRPIVLHFQLAPSDGRAVRLNAIVAGPRLGPSIRSLELRLERGAYFKTIGSVLDDLEEAVTPISTTPGVRPFTARVRFGEGTRQIVIGNVDPSLGGIDWEVGTVGQGVFTLHVTAFVPEPSGALLLAAGLAGLALLRRRVAAA